MPNNSIWDDLEKIHHMSKGSGLATTLGKCTARGRALEQVAEVLRHALELDHLGEGSTRGWAIEALAELEKGEGNK